MLPDRPFRRGDYQQERTSVLTWLICALVAGFAVQIALGAPGMKASTSALEGLALTVAGFSQGWLWTLVTHSFLHDPHFILHVVFNLGALYLLGRELLPMLGRRSFLSLFALANGVGGLAWLAAHWQGAATETHVGASAAVYAFFVVFTCFFPRQELRFLVLFIPVTLRPKSLALSVVALELISLVFLELPRVDLPLGLSLASSAHLGGALTGFLFYRFRFDSNWLGRAPDEAALTRSATGAAPSPPATAHSVQAPEDVRAEVDRILDKINSQGLQALTPEERRALDEARNQLSRP